MIFEKKNGYFDIKKNIIKNNIIENIIININYFSLNIIKLIIIIILHNLTKSNRIDSKYSKITLKIKGEGENTILGNETDEYFEDINFLKEVYINGIKQNTLEYKYIFNQTENFVELIFDEKISNCKYMFYQCNNITEINLSNFDTSQVTDMHGIFSYCLLLSSLDLSNFNTSQVINMNEMFYHCHSLTSLNLSNFNTSQVTSMTDMFSYCSSLTSLNLSNFDTSKVSRMPTLFNSCTNLEYINIYNFNEYELIETTGMFNNVPENIVICLNENTTCKYILPEIRKKKCYIIDCSNDWKSKQKKIIYNTNQCLNSCSQINLYEYNGKCYENCLNGVLYDDNYNISNKCKCELDKCLTCPIVALYYNLCEKCNINYYPKENDPSNLGDYINCYNQSEEGYYLDYNYNLYKKCYHTCKICNISGNNLTHNCIECKDNFLIREKMP